MTNKIRNYNTKTDDYYEMRINGAYLNVYAKLTKNGETRTCKCCGKTCENYFRTYYIDENDNEICETYGTECFKKIATFDDSIFAF